ncbi:MAG: right-handed parallel beta-helix repeat-containing protein [Planctomycetota bacterium]
MSLHRLLITTIACLAVAAAPAGAAEMTVQNASQLQAALGSATGGDVILLTGGDYGWARLQNYQFDSPVTLRAADRTDPPVFKGLRVDSGDNLVFDGLVFFRGETVPEGTFYALADLYGGQNLTFVYCRFHGATIESGDAAGYGSGFGVFDRGTTNLTVRRCAFTIVRKGVVSAYTSTVGLVIEQNFLYNYREDAFKPQGADMVVADNIVLDNTPRILPDGAGDHCDMIQGCFRDTVIRDNFFRGTGQGIHANGYSEDWGPHPDFAGGNTISNNIFYISFVNGINHWSTPGSMVAHNTVLAPWDPSPAPVKINIGQGLGSDGARVEYNIAERTVEDTPGVTYTGNQNVQRDDPDGWPTYLGDVLVGGLPNDQSPIADFVIRADAFPGSTETPGADLSEFFWLNVGDPSDPTNEMYPLWLQLDATGRAKLVEVLGLPTTPPGDADEDGDVDLDDFCILKNSFGATSGATWADGDFDGDGDVDLDDFVMLKSNFGS